MASLLNDLADKLDVLADNNTNEPNDPTNVVVEDTDTDDSTLLDVLTVDEVNIVETRAR